MTLLRLASRVQCAVEGHVWNEPELRSRYGDLWRQTCSRCGFSDYPSEREREARKGFVTLEEAGA